LEKGDFLHCLALWWQANSTTIGILCSLVNKTSGPPRCLFLVRTLIKDFASAKKHLGVCAFKNLILNVFEPYLNVVGDSKLAFGIQ